MDVVTGATVTGVRRDGPGRSVLLKTAAGGERELGCGQVPVAAGRPVTAGLNLAAVGVRAGHRGEVVTDARQRTGNPRIWAAGDVTGGPPYVCTAAANALFMPNGRWTTPPCPVSRSPARPSPQPGSPRRLGDSAVAELEAADLVHLDGEEVAVACPFSGRPTRQQAELDGLPARYAMCAMCAIDALGIPAMTRRNGRIAGTGPRGAPVVVSVRDGRWRWTPAGTVVVFARTADCGTDCASWEVMCPHTAFHASRDSAQAYLAARPDIDGKILDQQAAVESGRRGFGPLLGGPA